MKKVKKMAMGGLGKAIKAAAAKSAASKTPTKISSVGVPASEGPVNPNFKPPVRFGPIDSVGGRQVNLSPTPQPASMASFARTTPSASPNFGAISRAIGAGNRNIQSYTGTPQQERAAMQANQAAGVRTMGGMGPAPATMKKGGKVKTTSASKRADGIAQRGKTRGKII